ncbi:hypothetical protein HA402_009702 [Bradysia odoriphaga]|nr:hypothetical protein HA402_009702 [Bradysia odoriphaga]
MLLVFRTIFLICLAVVSDCFADNSIVVNSQSNSYLRNKEIENEECTWDAPDNVLSVSIGPCLDSPGCSMPDCCGFTSGRLTNISIIYVAPIDMVEATTHGYIVGASVGDMTNPLIHVPLPTTQVPNLAVTYDYESCNWTPCPQKAGKVYRFDGLFTIPTTALTTLVVNANFVAQVKSNAPGNPILFCRRIYARILNPEIARSVTAVLTNPLLGVTLLG